MVRLTRTLKNGEKNQQTLLKLQFLLYGAHQVGQTPHIT